jgi:hypothetical protein
MLRFKYLSWNKWKNPSEEYTFDEEFVGLFPGGGGTVLWGWGLLTTEYILVQRTCNAVLEQYKRKVVCPFYACMIKTSERRFCSFLSSESPFCPWIQ